LGRPKHHDQILCSFRDELKVLRVKKAAFRTNLNAGIAGKTFAQVNAELLHMNGTIETTLGIEIEGANGASGDAGPTAIALAQVIPNVAPI
jgi:hypothetical protein